MQGLDKRQFRKHGCQRSRHGQCRSEHSRRYIGDKYRGRTCRSPSLDVFHQDRLISSGIDLHIKLISAADSFVCKLAAPGAGAAQQNYKMAIKRVDLIIHTKQLTSTAQTANKELLQVNNMRTHYSRVKVKHLSISANQNLISFDKVFSSVLPDMVIVGLVSDADHAGGYQRNPFNFKNFDVNRIELKRNGMPDPRNGYTWSFNNGQYKKDYMTFIEQFDCDSGDKCISLTQSKLATGHTLYTFKITDGPIITAPTVRDPSLPRDLCAVKCHLQQHNTKTSKLFCSIKCWAGSSSTDFKTSLFYERWWTLR